jgi:hypothetical protein
VSENEAGRELRPIRLIPPIPRSLPIPPILRRPRPGFVRRSLCHSIFWIFISSGGMVKVARASRRTVQEGKTANGGEFAVDRRGLGPLSFCRHDPIACSRDIPRALSHLRDPAARIERELPDARSRVRAAPGPPRRACRGWPCPPPAQGGETSAGEGGGTGGEGGGPGGPSLPPIVFPSTVEIRRPDDLLVCTLRFVGFAFLTHPPRLDRAAPDAYVIVEFPPQSFGEEAFLLTSGQNADAPDSTQQQEVSQSSA